MPYEGPIFDGDSHIYETGPQAWNDYLPAKYRADYAVRLEPQPDGHMGFFLGKTRIMLQDALNRAGPDGGLMVVKPGSLKEFLKAQKTGEESFEYIPVQRDHQYPEERLKKMDEFGVEASFVYQGLHNSVPGHIADPDARFAVGHAFNQFLAEHWGYARQNRLFAAPMLFLDDLDKAVAETEWIIRQGARIVLMPFGPAQGRSPADPFFDPVWSRLHEAGVIVAYHVAEADYLHPLMRQWGEQIMPPRNFQSAWSYLNIFGEAPLIQTFSSLIYYNLFERFPNLRVLSVENGSMWLPEFLKKMDKNRGLARKGYWPCGQLKARPSQIFKQHFFVVPYPEDNVKLLVDQVGTADIFIMGSDYPHAEGAPTPRAFADEALKGLTPEQVRAIMYDNGRRLLPKAA